MIMSPKKPYRPPRNSNYPLPSASVDAAPFYRPPLAEEYGSRKAYEAAQGYWDRTQALYASCGLEVPDGPYVGRLAPPGPPAWMKENRAKNSYDPPGPKYDPLERFSQSLARRRQRLSHPMVRSTIQRLGRTMKPLT